jgi:hypothetical protein
VRAVFVIRERLSGFLDGQALARGGRMAVHNEEKRTSP